MTRARYVSNPQAIDIPLTVSANLTANAVITVGNSSVNSVITSNTYSVGSNVSLSTSRLFLGNSTVNSVLTASTLDVGANVNLSTVGLNVGSNTVNAYINSTSFAIGNSTVNTAITSTTITSTALLSIGNTNITGTANVSTGINVGANVNLGTAYMDVGNSTVNTTITNITVSTNTVNVASIINVGANVSANTTALRVGNSTVNTVITSTSLSTNGITVSGGTANGVAYLNSSKVVTTGSALVFDGTNLGVGTTTALGRVTTAGSGDQSIWFTHTDNVPARTVTLRLGNSDSTYKTYSPYVQAIEGSGFDNYSLAFGTSNSSSGGAVERARIDSSGNLLATGGFIPTNTSRLVVRGYSAISYNNTFSTANATVQIISDEMSVNQWYPTVNITMVRQSLTTGANSFGGIGFSTIDDSNNSGMYDAGRIAIVNDTGSAVASGTSMAFYTQVGSSNTVNAAIERMRIDSSGNVGVGTSSPSFKLDIAGGDDTNSLRVFGNSTYGPAIRLQYTGTGGKAWNIISNSGGNAGGAGALQFWNSTDSVTAMVINPSGNITAVQAGQNMALGNTSASLTGAALTVYGWDGSISAYTTRAESPYNAALNIGNLPTSGAGTGTGIVFRAASSTNTNRSQGEIFTYWTTNTDSTRYSEMVFRNSFNSSMVNTMILTSNCNIKTNEGVISPLIYINRSYEVAGANSSFSYNDLTSNGSIVNLKDHPSSGLNSMFHSGFSPASYNEETMNWRYVRIIFRGTRAGNSYDNTAVSFRTAYYFYGTGWTYVGGTVTTTSTDSDRGARTIVLPWISSSDFGANGFDVPGLGIVMTNNGGSVTYRLAAAYIQFKY